ncbi:CalY family protein [Metabacillus sp. GX 13764]|uniref:TasA family protein n=1 Tax=Metabacillus kandeliae TaxID=2900151 RepID=UPI001E4F4949|nr:TasA family protein [Metabacillus kandeliae]MCD7033169.1 CalY family protein [Metabacillus kandeliae]
MGIKKKLGLGLATAALGLSLVGGGTYAYFNDKADATSSFAAGTLDIEAKPSTIIDVKNLKPGDYMIRTFKLQNKGSLDMKKVLLTSNYMVTDANGNNAGEDFGKYIKVDFLYNSDKNSDVIYDTTLDQLKTKDGVDAVEKGLMGGEKSGLKAGKTDEMYVMFTFEDNGQDQNKFQGDSMKLTWTFEGTQGAGELK